MRIHLLAITLSFLSISLHGLAASAEESVGGLYFYSHEQIKENRTSLELNPYHPFELSHGFKLTFDLKIRNEHSIFGYIFRIIANETLNIDLLTSHSEGKDAFWFVVGLEKKKLIMFDEIPGYERNAWMTVALQINPSTREYSLTLNGKTISIKNPSEQIVPDKFKFYFGKIDMPKFLSTDAAPMIIKNLSINTLAGKQLYMWQMRQHGGSFVLDKVSSTKAIVNNPKWMVDSHVKWSPTNLLRLNEKPQIAYNDCRQTVCVVLRATVYEVHFGDNPHIDTVASRSGSAYYSLSNQLIYHPAYKELWSYDIGNPVISRYNYNTKSWSDNPGDAKEPGYWHHNAFVSASDSALYCIGGYGYHMYHRNLLKYSLANKCWRSTDYQFIMEPRYLAAVGIIDEEVLIYGGFGSKSGEQQVSPRSFNDLYSINLNTHFDKKCWEGNKVDGLVNSQNLVFEQNHQSFFTLGYSGKKYNTWIELYKTHLKTGEQQTMGDSISYQFSDTESFCNLFYLPQSKEFIAVTLHKDIGNMHIVQFYKLDAPALSLTDIVQSDPASHERQWSALSLLVLIILSGGIITTVLFVKKRRNNNSLPPLTSYAKTETTDTYLQRERKAEPSSVSLIGGFQAINRLGEDITASFTPTLKHLLLLIILYTQKNNKGIGSGMLQEILWFDKTETNARNNKNVNLHKLKTILEEFDGINICNENSYWIIEVVPPGVCDYLEVMTSARYIKMEEPIPEDQMARFINNIIKGPLLPNIQSEWVDAFKAEFTSDVIDSLRLVAKKTKHLRQYEQLIALSDAILSQDSMDEEAIQGKCFALIQLGRQSAASSAFSFFSKEYMSILGSAPPFTLKQIVEDKLNLP